MPSDNGILGLLADFGLTPTEAAVYATVVSLGGGSTKVISNAAGKERAQTHHALEKLEQLGIVESTLSVPTEFRPISTVEAVDHLYSLHLMKLQKLRGQRKNLVEELDAIRTKSVIPSETYSIVKGRLNTYLKMIESIHASTREVSLVMSARGLVRLRKFRNFYQIMKSKSRRGVNIKVISEITSDNLEDAKAMAAISDFRHSRNQMTNASIYDGKIGSVALTLSEDLLIDAKNHIAVWTTAQSFISTLRSYFDSVWFVSGSPETTIKTLESDSSIQRSAA